jgi:hypothetical protein
MEFPFTGMALFSAIAAVILQVWHRETKMYIGMTESLQIRHGGATANNLLTFFAQIGEKLHSIDPQAIVCTNILCSIVFSFRFCNEYFEIPWLRFLMIL